MLFRRRVVTSTPERDVVVVKPRRPTGLYVALGLGTLFAMGLVAYLSWALPRTDEPEYETTAVIMDDDVDGRAQRMNPTAPNPAPNPTNVIVNPPPVVTTPPPVITTPPPVVVRPPERTTIVEGAGVDPAPARRNPPQNQNQNQNQDQTDRTDNTDGGSTSDGGDVDGTVPDRQ